MRRFVLSIVVVIATLSAGSAGAEADVVDGLAKPFTVAGTIYAVTPTRDATATELIVRPVTATSNNVAGHVFGGGMHVRLAPTTKYFRQYVEGGAAEQVSAEDALEKGRPVSIRGRLAPVPTTVGKDAPIAESVTVVAAQETATYELAVPLEGGNCRGDDYVTYCRNSGTVPSGDLAGWRFTVNGRCEHSQPFYIELGPDYSSTNFSFSLANGQVGSVGSTSANGEPDSSLIVAYGVDGTGRFGGIDGPASFTEIRITQPYGWVAESPDGGRVGWGDSCGQGYVARILLRIEV